ncbi:MULTISPECIES: glycosyltransferase [Marinobacter]|uniref:glycosyltransferase n=1 Tax=Marinobacter TaxID=2742 RepID=UPI000C3FF946|nr:MULTISPECIES: glycosyltransferase [Marinobacter]MAO13078.1 hypothetical protein [Marinobacter sp.]|tara:strand:- start:1783 stop:2832 length:1050 start_codon:yes stop_codon:yes gene_type:complete
MKPKKIHVLSIGPVSYVGGINVHMIRLAALLDGIVVFDFIDDAPPQIATDVSICIRKANSIPHVLRKIWQSDIVHIHSGNWLLRILLVLICCLLQAKVVITLHSYRFSGLKKLLSDAVLRLANEVICVNPDIKSSSKRADALVKEAFIPPVDAESRDLPDEIDAFINRHRGSLLICANAYRLARHEGKDLYGLDQCLAVARQAKIAGDNIVILFVVGTVTASDDLYHSAQRAIEDEGLDEFICIYPKSLDFITLIRRSDIVIRPTITDGDALTIREAIFLGKPVIASNVVARPAGTVTYRSGNAEDLYAAIRSVASALASGDRPTDQAETCSMDLYKQFYLEVYEKCIS